MKKSTLGLVVFMFLLNFSVIANAAPAVSLTTTLEASGAAKLASSAREDSMITARKKVIRRGYLQLADQLRAAFKDGSLSQVDGLDKHKIRYILRKAKLVDEQVIDGVYKVKLELRVQDTNRNITYNEWLTFNVKAASDKLYTGVIIDSRGLPKNLARAMSPMILDMQRNVVYGNHPKSSTFVAANGMVDYAEDIEDIEIAYAGLSRAGSHPLYIKAIDLTDFNRNVVISREDARRIQIANNDAGFLENTAVVFIQ